MKHIFTVHSPITFLCAYGIIQKEQIPEHDVIILTSGYKVPFELGHVAPAFQDTQLNIWHKLIHWNVPKAFDKYLESLLIGNTFVAYIDLMAPYQRILITNRKCQQFHFMEEGMASYILATDLHVLTRGSHLQKFHFRQKGTKSLFNGLIRMTRGHTLRILSLPFNAQSYAHIKGIKFYTFSEDGFPAIELEKKRVLEISPQDNLIDKMALTLKLESVIIWVEDSYFKSYHIPELNAYQAIEKSIQNINSLFPNYRHFIKLKPPRTEKTSLMLKTLKDTGIEPEVLSNELIIEALLLRSTDCIVVGCISSVLYYAAIFGHHAFSIFDFIINKPVTVYDDFEIYWNKVERLRLKA